MYRRYWYCGLHYSCQKEFGIVIIFSFTNVNIYPSQCEMSTDSQNYRKPPKKTDSIPSPCYIPVIYLLRFGLPILQCYPRPAFPTHVTLQVLICLCFKRNHMANCNYPSKALLACTFSPNVVIHILQTLPYRAFFGCHRIHT